MSIAFFWTVVMAGAWSAPAADEVDQIANGVRPESPALKLVLTEDLRIGPDDGEDWHLWSGAYVTVDVDAAGRIYVADTGGDRVLVFGPDGEYLRQIGGPGAGPGEFQGLYSFAVLNDGAVAFSNNQELVAFHFFDADMAFLEREPLLPQPVFIQSADFSPNGRWIAATYMKLRPQEGMLTAYTGVLTRKKEEKITLSQQDQTVFDETRMRKPAFWVEFLAGWFRLASRGVGVSAFDRDGTLYTANTSEYTIDVWSSDLKKQRTISRQYKPISLTEAQRDAMVEPIRQEVLAIVPAFLQDMITEGVIRRAVEKADFLPRKMPIFSLVPMDGKGLLVIHDYDPATGDALADIFTPDGRFRGQSKLPRISVNLLGGFFGGPTSIAFRGDRAYTAETNADGEFEVVRYRFVLKPR